MARMLSQSRLHEPALRRWSMVGLLSLLVAGWCGTPRAEPYREDVVKAAFLYRFTGYMDWPPQALGKQEFTIAVLGGTAVAEELRRIIATHPVKNLPARIRSIDSARQATDAHVLYIGTQYPGELRRIIETLEPSPILIVTDRPTGLDEGATVNFLLIDRRVRFEVSLPAAQRAGLKVSSELLAVAARVRGTSSRTEEVCSSSFAWRIRAACAARVANLEVSP
jgi:hypothetical protein